MCPIPIGHGVDECLQRELGIADEGVLDFNILIEIHWIESGVDDGLIAGHGYAKPGQREATSDAQNNVRFGEVGFDSAWVGSPS